MTTCPTFSIVIPTYNYGRYVGRAIDSALACRGPAREVIVVDDGSTDDTTAVLQAYGSQIIACRQANQGVSVARNRGIAAASGEFVVCLDADDTLLPEALETFAAVIENHPAVGLVFGGYWTVQADGRRVPGRVPPPLSTPIDNFRHYLQRRFTIGNGRAAIRRTLFDRVQYPAGVTHGEDLVVFGQILALAPAVSVTTPVSDCYDHQARARRNFERMLDNGDRTIAALFDPAILPPDALALQPMFAAEWQLDLARAAFKLGRHTAARRHYRSAWQMHWPTLLNLRQLARYARTFWPRTTTARG